MRACQRRPGRLGAASDGRSLAGEQQQRAELWAWVRSRAEKAVAEDFHLVQVAADDYLRGP